jgi:hypothetical protein
MASSSSPLNANVETNQHAFERLHWNIWDNIEDIKVSDDAGDVNSPLLPLLNHSIRQEPATSPAKNKMKIVYQSLNDHLERNELLAPPPLLIEKSNGYFITVHNFIIAVDQYIKSLRKVIVDTLDLGQTEQLWFTGTKYAKASTVIEETFVVEFCKESDDPGAQRRIRNAEIIQNERLWTRGVHRPGEGPLSSYQLQLQLLEAGSNSNNSTVQNAWGI